MEVTDMIMTIVHGEVKQEYWQLLKQAYAEAGKMLPPGLERSYLIQLADKQEQWQIISVWESREALVKMRSSGETPAAIRMFRAAHSEPVISVFTVVDIKEMV